MKFEQALQALRAGKEIKRKTWCCNFDSYCTIDDLLADDWEIVGEEQPKQKKYLSEAIEGVMSI